MKESVPLIIRILSAILGLLLGAMFGMLALAFLMIVVGSDFGLDSVRLGAVVGAVLGFCWACVFRTVPGLGSI